MPNPDLVLNKIGGRIEALNELKYDSHVASCIQSRKSGVLSHEWEFTEGTDQSVAPGFLKDIFDRLNLPSIISEILEAPLLGYKVLEIIWREENGYIVPVDIIGKPSEWFFFDELNICRFRNSSNVKGEILSPRKFFVVQHNATYNNPYGEALLSKCYWPVFYKKEVVKFWATFCEKYGMPFIWASVPFGSDTDDMMNKMEDLKQDGIVITEGDSNDNSVTLLDASKSSSPDLYSQFIGFFNSEISKAILSQTLTTEIQDKGTYAASKTHSEVRQDIIDADKRLVENCFNKLIDWVIEFNFGNIPNIPKFRLYQEEDVDLTLADRDSKLTSSGQVRLTKEYYIRNYGFKDDEIEIIQAAPAPSFADSDKKKDNFDLFAKEVEPIVNHIIDLISTGSSYNDIQDLVVKLYPELNTEEIEKHISHAVMLSYAAGQFEAGKQ